jgi:hypothetical protein
MATGQQSQAVPDQQPLGPSSRQPPTKIRTIPLRVIVLLALLIIAVVAGATLAPGGSTPIARAPGIQAAQTAIAQRPPALSNSPVCPIMRTDPTFGISLLDVTTGQALCERNPNGIAQPASTTKVMTALLTGAYLRTHHLGLDTLLTIKQVDKDVEKDAAVAYLQVGQVYSVGTLLYMASILSAADATMALARFVAGSRSAFVTLMNAKARQLGMLHTHYSSPYGYAKTSPDHWQRGESISVGNYSSAHDMALLMRAFASYPELVSIFGAHDYHAGFIWLDRASGYVLPDSWAGLNASDNMPVHNLHLPFQVLAVKKGCMWCTEAIHKLSYVLLVRFRQQTISAAFLYTTQDYANPLVGDMLPTLLWAFHQCSQPAYSHYC